MPSIEIFNKFDQVAIAEAERPAPQNFTQSIRRLSALIDQLPQRSVIEDKDAERWVNRCIEMAITRMELEHGEGNASVADVHNHVLWHVRRASAIGGSEIGTVVKHFRGERGGFTNARNLVLEKLLKMAPQPGDEAMNRGVRAEPWIQRMYLEETGAVSDEEALDVLKGFRWDKAPQLVGTPDDLVIYQDNTRKIIDYKCPSADVNADYERKGEVSFDYVCQVHQYGVFSKCAGIKFSGMEVICFDPRSFKLVPYVIEPDKALVAEMFSSSATLWDDFVMKGVLPEVPGPAALETDNEELRAQMEDLTMQASVLKVLKDEVEERQKEVLSRVKHIGQEAHDLSEGKIDLGFASFKRERSWDEERLTNMAEAVGLDAQDYMVSNGKFDPKEGEALLREIFDVPEDDGDGLISLIQDMRASGGFPEKSNLDVEALIAALEEEGVSVLPAAGISERFAISRAKKNADIVGRLKAQAIDLADTVEEVVEDQASTILDPQDLEEDDMMVGP